MNDVLRATADALISKLQDSPSAADVEAATTFLHRQGWNVDRALAPQPGAELDNLFNLREAV